MSQNDLPEGCDLIPGGIDAELPPNPVRFRYKNWEGKVADRTVLPKRIFLGKSKWHPEVQLMMLADDLDRGAPRTFAVRDILEFLPLEELVGEKSYPTEDEPDAEQPAEPVLGKVRLIQDPGSGRLVHNGEPSWRVTAQAIAEVDGQAIHAERGDDETIFVLSSGEHIGFAKQVDDNWHASIRGFQFWGFSEKHRRETYLAEAVRSTRDEAELYMATVFIQAGATIQ